jgi:glutaminyl-tRNA synthetase
MSTPSAEPEHKPSHFLHEIIEADLARGLNDRRVHTRFPPEPNGYLHIGHAKAICVNFGLAGQFPGGKCNLRFDDTNPSKEEHEYVDAILEDVRWLGFDWEDRLYYASDYFEQLFEMACELIEKGAAYVCDLSVEDTRKGRGAPTEPGQDSPFRARSAAENLDLFRRMRAGEFPDGARSLRAKIDMAHKNLLLRDPVLYRIMHASHHRTGDAWCIYPTYDFAHGQSDALEGITHSLCTLEFENHRPLYDWLLDHLSLPHRPRQYEFARLNLTYTMMSKRRLLQLVQAGHVSGWDDPRMPTLRGLRRRGYTPEAIRSFAEGLGVTRINSRIDVGVLEAAVREDLNRRAPRRMAVLQPLKVVIENYPEGQVEQLECVNNPEDPSAGTRPVPFSRVIYVERDDFRAEAPRKYFRLTPGREVRLRYAYYVTCTGFEQDPATGEITEVRCSFDPQTRGGDSPDGRKVKGTIHWVSAEHAFDTSLRLYDHLFGVPDPLDVEQGRDFTEHLNPESLVVLEGCKLEPALASAAPGDFFQFERQGYFIADGVDSRPGAPAFQRTVALRDSWSKIERKEG